MLTALKKAVGYMKPDIDYNTKLYIPFNENCVGGIAKDYSNFANNATLTDVTSTNVGYDGAGVFNGTSSLGNCGNDASLDILGAISIEARVNPLVITGDRMILGNATSNVKGYDLFATDGGYATYRTNQAGVNQKTISLAALSVGLWAQIIVTRSGATAKIYLDGIETTYSQQDSHINPVSTDTDFIIGRYAAAAAAFFNGIIDEVLILAKAQPSQQIAANSYETPSA